MTWLFLFDLGDYFRLTLIFLGRRPVDRRLTREEGGGASHPPEVILKEKKFEVQIAKCKMQSSRVENVTVESFALLLF